MPASEAGKGDTYRPVDQGAYDDGWDRVFNNPKQDLESPCVEVCQFDYAKGVCIGCHRTLNEISAWLHCSNDEKQRILANATERKKHAESNGL